MLSTTSGLASNMTPYLFLAESDGVSVPNFDKYICARGQKHHFTVIACVSHTDFPTMQVQRLQELVA